MNILSSKYSFLGIVFVLGCLVILSYIYILPRVQPRRSIDALWFGIDGYLRLFYYAFMVLTTLSFIIALVWIWNTFRPSVLYKQFILPYATFLVGAILWSITLWLWGQSQQPSSSHPLTSSMTKGFVILSLLITSVGSGWILYSVYKQSYQPVPWWVYVALIIVFIHVFVLDNIGWTIAFLKNS